MYLSAASILDFVKDNKLYFIIGAAVVLIAIVVIIAACVRSSKKRRAAAKTADAPQTTADAAPKAVEAPSAAREETPAAQPVKREPAAEKKPSVAPDEQDVSAAEQPVEDNSVQAETAEEKPAETEVAAAAVVEKTPEKKAAKKITPVQEKTETKPRKGYSGKWVIIKKAADEFVAHLYASNGELLLTSETYSTPKGAASGIETVKRNSSAGNFEIYRDKNRNYYYKLKSSANRLLCVGEVYSSRTSCENSIASVKKFAESAVVATDIVEDMTLVDYVPAQATQQAKDGYTGKWLIRADEDGDFMSYLYASNGELLLTSESYSSAVGARGAIANIIKNAEANSFVIDKDKNGKFYYKLRNAQKSTLCVGEAYEKFASCVSAIESVKKYCSVAKIEEVTPEE